MAYKPFKLTQTVLISLMLALVLMSVLLLGGNSPVLWSLLSVLVALMLLVQVLVALNAPVPLAVDRLILPGFFFLAALGWGWVQIREGVSAEYAHPLWAYVPDAPAFISADPGQSRQALMRLFCYGGIFLITVWSCADTRFASRVLKAVAVFSTCVAAYGLYAFSTGENIFLGGAASDALVQSTFLNRNNFATYAVFGVLANLAAFLHVSTRQTDTLRGRLEGFFANSWVYAVGVLIGIGAVALTQSRAGAIAGLIGLAVFLLAWPRDKAQLWDRVMLYLLGATLIFITLTSATGLTERLLATSEEDGRFAIFPVVVQAIADRPLLGHGPGAFHDAFRPYVPAENASKEWIRAHNTYLELAFGFGLPAMLSFFAAQGLIVWRIFRGTRVRRINRAFSCFALGCAAAAAFHSLFDFSLQMPAVAALFAVILGLGYSQSFVHSEIAKHDAAEKRRRNA